MKHYKWFGLMALVFASACQSQPKLLTADNDNTLLWQISGKELKNEAYVFGTMHILCPEDSKLSPSMVALLGMVKAIYFEVDMDDMVQMVGSMKSMNMKDETRLVDLLSLEDYEKVSAYFSSKSKLPFKMIENYKPMLLSSMIAEQEMPCKATNGMELTILNEANKHKAEIKGLETLSFQAGLFDSIPYAEQAKELVKAIDSTIHQSGQLDSMMKFYRDQDLNALDKMINSTEAGLEAKYMDLLLYNRNRNWANQFETVSKDGPILIAVGAGHLAGQQGLLQLLRQKGYTVKPMKN